ncbi:UvrD-helicase domain-containing protein [Candidatus Poriferisocius sp.]|uniref:UvrD-helicase domain-containing protein n=1 Tax=Candidatus Poriferisocius sp. TaxID=3101276 RepID=UPI003B02C60E
MLSREQRAFVDHARQGHARLLAGPGTGKSFASVAFLENLAIMGDPPRCHMITFTRAATQELQEKFSNAEVAITERPPSTAHSFALWLLMHDSHEKLRMADDWEKRHLVEEAVKARMKAAGHSTTIKEVEELTGEMASGWQSLDNEQIFLSDQDPVLAEGFRGAWVEAQRTLDFVHVSEIPYKAVQLVEDVGIDDLELDVLVVDEFQDLNAAEVRLLRLLADHIQIIAIGDDDQSIYSWRNAAPSALLRYCDEFSAESFHLTKCYRSPAAVLDPAIEVIGAMPGRSAKARLVASDPDRPGVFAQLRFTNSAQEFDGVVDIVKKRLSAGIKPDDIAILVRSSADRFRKEMLARFEAEGIRITNSDWIKNALKEPEVRRLVAFARLIADPSDSLAWMGLLHETPGIGDVTLMGIYGFACEEVISFGAAIEIGRSTGFEFLSNASRVKVVAAVAEIHAVLSDLRGEHEGALLDERGWGGWLVAHSRQDSLSEDAVTIFESVGEQVALSSTSGQDAGLGGFINQFQPLALDLANNQDGAVRLMSMAQSKGLTVNTAILMAVDDDTIPLPSADEDEERRILYVAMTRASECCIITTATYRHGATAKIGSAGNARRRRTRFLQGLPPSVPAPQDGPSFIKTL